jgi:hypothetical protein
VAAIWAVADPDVALEAAVKPCQLCLHVIRITDDSASFHQY